MKGAVGVVLSVCMVPKWAARGFQVRINGQPQSVNAVPGTYATLSRTWNNQDGVELQIPFPFHLDCVMDQPNIASLFFGPVLLAAEESETRSGWRPVTLDATDIGKSITGNPGALRFNLGDTAFRPFYEMYGRYSVYLDVKFK